ncbi:MAG: UxaA family hydrolase [Candidatus Bathyarchaeota archaeon]|nr:UxaA family hydrolase [Candidatus Bathyarchaeota archaeon]
MSFIVVDKRDNVATAIADLGKGETVEAGEWSVRLVDDIKYGHKFALVDIPENEYVVKYGERIGRATERIQRGAHVHAHNVEDIVDEVRKL